MVLWRSFVIALLVVGIFVLMGGLPASAQDEVLTRTFELPTVPAVAGPLAGVDPAGQTVSYWHQHTGDRSDVMDTLVAE
ncbi:hypothetical protein ACFLYO_10885, partial [Chloroflexota bacterium]